MKKRRNYLLLGAILTLVLGLFAAVTTVETLSSERAGKRARSILLDSAVEQSATLVAILDGQFQLLETIAADVPSKTAVENDAFLRASAARTHFSAIGSITPEGELTVTGETSDIAQRDYFQKSIRGARAMQRIERYSTGEPAIVLSVPILEQDQKTTQQDTVRGALCGFFNEVDLSALLTSEAYGGAGYSLLVDTQGNIIVRAENEIVVGDNKTLNFLRDASFDDGLTYALFMKKMRQGEGFTFSYSMNDYHRVVAAVPFVGEGLPQSDWVIINAVSSDAFRAETRAERINSFVLFVILLVACAIATAHIILYQKTIQETLRKEAEELRLHEERFRIVVAQCGRMVFQYDIPTKTYIREAETHSPFDTPPILPDMLDAALSAGWVEENSVPALKNMFERMERGESPLTVDLKLVMPDGTHRWHRFHATTIYSDSGAPLRAIISYADCTQQRERELAYSRWEQDRNEMLRDNVMLIEWNLSKDLFEEERGQLRIDASFNAPATFDERVRLYAEKKVYEPDRGAYRALMNRERLIGMFHSGRFGDTLDFREIQDDERLCWRRLTVQLIMYPTSEDVKAYVTLRDIDEIKQVELALIEQAEIDPLTGAYNRSAFVKRVTELIREHPEQNHVVMMLDIDEFKNVNDTFGHDIGDQLLQSFAEAARGQLRQTDLVGRVGGDEFMVCIPNVSSNSVIAKKARELSAALRKDIDKTHTVSASIGIAVYARDGMDFSELYKKADIALYKIKKSGKNSFCFYAEGMDASGNTLTQIDSPEET